MSMLYLFIDTVGTRKLQF